MLHSKSSQVWMSASLTLSLTLVFSDEPLLPQELCPTGQSQGCADVEFQASVKGNFEPMSGNLVLLACDASTLAKAENVLNGGHPQHAYIKL